jgi:hypothetical protein
MALSLVLLCAGSGPPAELRLIAVNRYGLPPGRRLTVPEGRAIAVRPRRLNMLMVVVDGWRDPGEALAGYERWLVGLPLSERTRRKYSRWVGRYCGWLRDGIDERAAPTRGTIRGPGITPRGTSSGF